MGTSSRLHWSAQLALAIALIAATFAGGVLFATTLARANPKLPPGLEVSVYAEGVTDARGITLGDDGTLFVGTPQQGLVYAIAAPLGDAKPRVSLLASDVQGAHAVIGSADVTASLDDLQRRLAPNTLDELVGYASNPATGEITLTGIELADSAAGKSTGDVAVAPDGSMFVADGDAGVVYRIALRTPERPRCRG
jgi:glucose/arabinose dehydrogenase